MNQIQRMCLLLGLILSMPGCTQTGVDIVSDPFPEAQAEIAKVLDEIFRSAQSRDFDRLGAFHAYGPKFSEFKNGEHRADSERNEQTERELFASLSDLDYDLRDLKVSVYGEVAIATFHGFFEATAGGQPVSWQVQSTLVFVKVSGSWKIVHEHFSPLSQTEQG